MKKKLLLTIFLIVIPFIIDAKMKNDFERSSACAAHYLDEMSDLRYDTYYILDEEDFENNSSTNNNVPFRYESGVFSGEDYFYGGGLLNLDEFNISKDRQGNTYLYNGNDYWTMTTTGVKAYKITNATAKQSVLEDMSSTSGTRITEYLRESKYIAGNGSYNNPWHFYMWPN